LNYQIDALGRYAPPFSGAGAEGMKKQIPYQQNWEDLQEPPQ
jgi:hypothetical protein